MFLASKSWIKSSCWGVCFLVGVLWYSPSTSSYLEVEGWVEIIIVLLSTLSIIPIQHEF